MLSSMNPTPSRRALSFISFAAALGALACNASVEVGARPDDLRRPSGARSSGAAESADPVRLASDVAWLADDARAGRRAGTSGEAEAAEWLAARMGELGLEPAGDDGYQQAFEVPLEPEEGGRSWVMSLPGGPPTDVVPINGAEQIVPLFCSAGGGADGVLAFRGYGMVNEERDWNDYPDEGAVEGAVVMIVRGTPEVTFEETEAPTDPHATGGGDVHIASRSAAFGNSGSIFNKVMTAKRMGAAAVILAQHPRDRGEPLLAFHNGHTAKASIPAVTVSATVAEKLLPGYRERVGAIDAVALDTGARDARSLGEGRRVALSADVKRGKGTARNVLGILRGGRGDRTIVVGAHFDHLGLGGSGSLARESWGEIHNGADDNASGTAVVLELARLLHAGELEDDVLFALWSGEELGLLGSDHWAENPTVSLESVTCNLNFDMVGRAGEGVLQVLGAGTAEPFADWLEGPDAKAAGLELAVSLSATGMGGSDHQSFTKRAIPALHFFSGVHTDYHKPSDDVERFEADGAASTVELARVLLARADGADELVYVEVKKEEDDERQEMQSGWSTWFGSVPSYSWDGPGVKIDGTSAGSPAERAGFLAGDILTAMGEVPLDDIYDFVYALQVHKPGDVVQVQFQRDGEWETLTMTLGSRALE